MHSEKEMSLYKSKGGGGGWHIESENITFSFQKYIIFPFIIFIFAEYIGLKNIFHGWFLKFKKYPVFL